MDDLITDINSHDEMDRDDYIHTLDVGLIISLMDKSKPLYSKNNLNFSNALLMLVRIIFPNDKLKMFIYDEYYFLNDNTVFNNSHIDMLIEHAQNIHSLDIQNILISLCTDNECFLDFVIDQALANIKNDQPQYLLTLIKWFIQDNKYISMESIFEQFDYSNNKLIDAELDILKTINRHEPSMLGLNKSVDEQLIHTAWKTSKILNIDICQCLSETKDNNDINEIHIE